jgi:hypothetical protein
MSSPWVNFKTIKQAVSMEMALAVVYLLGGDDSNKYSC